MNPEEFEEALSNLFNQDLSPEDFAALECHLEESPEARRQYLDFVDLQNILEMKYAGPKNSPAGSIGVFPIDRIVARQKRRALRYALLASAAVFLILAIALRSVWLPEPEPLLSFEAAPDSSFTVTHARGSGDGPLPGTLKIGSRLLLSQGSIALTLSTGVTSIVRAPADLTLREENKLDLKQGIAWFQVPQSGHGFEVTTPDFVVTDLGTEFGIISAPDQLDEVHVFKGQVEIKVRYGLQKTERLKGPGARITGAGGRLKPSSLRPEDFLKTLPAGLPEIHFTFDSIKEGQLEAELSQIISHPLSAHFYPAALSTSTPSPSLLVPGKIGQALSFNGAGDFVETNWPGIADHKPRTVALWLRIPRDVDFTGKPAILAWGDTMGMRSKWKLQASHNEADQPVVPRLTFGYQWFNGETVLNDGQWHHLAAIYHGEIAEDGIPVVSLYVDGRPESLTPQKIHAMPQGFPDKIDPGFSKAMMMGKGLMKQTKTFRGEIDDLHIYEGILPEASIRELIRMAQE